MTKSKPTRIGLANERSKSIVKLINQAAYNKSKREVFNDFVEVAAISIANSMPHAGKANKEKRYLDIVNSYNKRHQGLLFDMFKELVLALDEHVLAGGPEDVLGSIFHELGMNSSQSSQFFTPQYVADMMATMTCGENELSEAIKQQGYIYLQEPACGSGVMITGVCKAMMRNGLNYNTQLLVEATDIDIRCVHMAYVQLSLYAVPATIIHGNALSLQEWSRWYTPFYFINRWDLKRKTKNYQASETI